MVRGRHGCWPAPVGKSVQDVWLDGEIHTARHTVERLVARSASIVSCMVMGR